MINTTARLGLTIDLNALCENYRIADRLAPNAETACVVKADAYGLGIKQVSTALAQAGAKSFFVATPEEGAELREVFRSIASQSGDSQADIYILNGFLPHAHKLFSSHQLRPCLASLDEIDEFLSFKDSKPPPPPPPPTLHIDTGINRLGISASDCRKLSAEKIQTLAPSLIMSHLACADMPDDDMPDDDMPDDNMNVRQLKSFNALREHLGVGALPASLANTAGIFLGSDYAFQMVRPGIGLYGGNPFMQKQRGLLFQPVIYLTSFIAQMRDIAIGENVGYGALFRAKRPTRIAIIPAGYADGYARAARGINVFIDGRPAPLIGRVSMDMLIADISDLPPQLAKRGQKVELLGAHASIADLARAAGTIAHNITAGLGRRLARHYIQA